MKFAASNPGSLWKDLNIQLSEGLGRFLTNFIWREDGTRILYFVFMALTSFSNYDINFNIFEHRRWLWMSFPWTTDSRQSCLNYFRHVSTRSPSTCTQKLIRASLKLWAGAFSEFNSLIQWMSHPRPSATLLCAYMMLPPRKTRKSLMGFCPHFSWFVLILIPL